MDAVVSFLFKYPSRVWARGDVVWSPVVPVWLVIVLAVYVDEQVGHLLKHAERDRISVERDR